MFLCQKCLEDNYLVWRSGNLVPWTEELWLGTPSSYGRCEDCHTEAPCYDINHSEIAHKESVYAQEHGYKPETEPTFKRIDHIIRNRIDIGYTRDERNILTLIMSGKQTLMFIPATETDHDFRVTHTDISDPNALINTQGIFKDGVLATKFFYKRLRMLVNNE